MESKNERKRLLMVEDNPGDVELMRFALKRAQVDCDLLVIDDGEEALALVRRDVSAQAPDLVLLDLNLPKVGGREILAAMRATSAFAEVPVVVLTSSSALREREQLKPLKIARHIVKPLDLEEFVKIGSIVKEMLDDLPAAAES